MERQVTFELKRSERELLLNVLDVDPPVQRKLTNAEHRGNLLLVTLSTEELSGLLAGLSAEAEATDDPNMRRAYEELQEKLESIAAAGGGGAAGE